MFNCISIDIEGLILPPVLKGNEKTPIWNPKNRKLLTGVLGARVKKKYLGIGRKSPAFLCFSLTGKLNTPKII